MLRTSSDCETGFGRHSTGTALVLGIVAYLFFSLTFLELPGLQYDEVLFVNAALGNVDGSFISWDLEVAGRRIPLMVMRYIGALKALLYTPVFALFGTSAASVRLPVVFVGLGTLVFTWLVVREMIGRKEALAAFVLLASDPAFIFANRLDWGPVSLMLALKMSALFLLWRWLESGRLALLGWAGFLLGLGLFDKITFAWFLGALVLALTLFFRDRLQRHWSRRALVLLPACFLLGSWPLIAYNIRFPLETFKHQQLVTTDWQRDLVNRYRLFQTTLDGTAVLDHINHETPADDARTLSGVLRGFVSGQRTANWYAVLLSMAVVLLLWMRGSLKRRKRVLFFLAVTVLLSAAICITAQGTGPHHVASLFPFTHILTAFALCAVVEAASRLHPAAGRAAGTVLVAALLVPQLAAGAAYLKSFKNTGGVGIWSDAIYELGSWAASQRDRTFLLMDWGFSNQLLALSPGIKKEESFVPLMTVEEEEKKIAALEPYVARAGALYVFHSPMFDTYSILHAFRQAAERRGLLARVAKPFFQRDGRPVYLVYEVVNPGREAAPQAAAMQYLREAETWDARSGGGPEVRPSASGGGILGNHWGHSVSDFVTYGFQAAESIPDAYLYIRYAFDDPQQRFLAVYLDGNVVDLLRLPPTGGFGDNPGQWHTQSQRIGTLDAGRHEIAFRPASPYQSTNIDCFYISRGPLWPPAGAAVEETAAARRPLGPDVLSFLDGKDVRLYIEPPVIKAGESTIGIRLENFEAAAFDLVYSVDGRLMPPVIGWRLEKDHTTSVFVDRNTPRGVYRYLAIRDSSRPSPTAWIPIQAQVRVR